MLSRGYMVFYNFECTQNMIDTETKRPVHEVNYGISMSIYDNFPDHGSCDNCLPVHTLSGLGSQNAPESFVSGLLIILSMKGHY